jgi:hypothetical protein
VIKNGNLNVSGGTVELGAEDGEDGTNFYYGLLSITGKAYFHSGTWKIKAQKSGGNILNDSISVTGNAYINTNAGDNASLTVNDSYGALASGDSLKSPLTATTLTTAAGRSTYFNDPAGWTEVVNAGTLTLKKN